MGAIIDAYSEPDFRVSIDNVNGSAVEKLIACMVRSGAWNDPDWLRGYIRETPRENVA